MDGAIADFEREDAMAFYKVRRERAQGVGRNGNPRQNSDPLGRAVGLGVGTLESLAKTTPRIRLRKVHFSKSDWLNSKLKHQPRWKVAGYHQGVIW